MDHLLSRQSTAGMPAHAIGHDGERDSTPFWMRNERHPVLLLLTIALVLGNAGIDHYCHDTDSPYGRKNITFGVIKSTPVFSAACCRTTGFREEIYAA